MPQNGSDDNHKQPDATSQYPDTGESGETYDLEFPAGPLDAMSIEAIDRASHFVREQRKQSSNMNKMNVR